MTMVEENFVWPCPRAGRRARFSRWPITTAFCFEAFSATTRSWRSCFTESFPRTDGMGTNLLHYRGWTGQFRGPLWSMLVIARIALSQVVRRKLFWVLYAFGLLFFFMFFVGQYLLAWSVSQMDEQVVTVGVFRTDPAQFVQLLRKSLRIDGSGEMYRNFFRFQGSMVVVILAMAGAVLVGNDFQFGSVPFYLAKPLSPWHYLLGKCLAVAVIINLMTTLPALVLYVQYGVLTSWDYFVEDYKLLFGIL